MWRALLEKDFAIIRGNWAAHVALLLAAGGMLALTAADHGLAGLGGEASVLVGAVSAAALPMYAFMVLVREWRAYGSGWLNVPLHGWVLLASKWVAATLAALSAWGVYAGVVWMVDRVAGHSPVGMPVGPAIALGGLALWVLGIYAAVWLTLVALVLQAARHHGVAWRWLVGAAVAAVPLVLIPNLAGWPLLRSVLTWRVALPALGSLYGRTLIVHGGQNLLPLLLTVAAFVAAARVLDRMMDG